MQQTTPPKKKKSKTGPKSPKIGKILDKNLVCLPKYLSVWKIMTYVPTIGIDHGNRSPAFMIKSYRSFSHSLGEQNDLLPSIYGVLSTRYMIPWYEVPGTVFCPYNSVNVRIIILKSGETVCSERTSPPQKKNEQNARPLQNCR